MSNILYCLKKLFLPHVIAPMVPMLVLMVSGLIFSPLRTAAAGENGSHFSNASAQSLDNLVYRVVGKALDFEDRLKLSAILSDQLGMTPIALGQGSDMAFLSFDLKKLVLLKSGIQLSSATAPETYDGRYEGVVVKTHAGYVYHGKSELGAPFALLFSGFDVGAIDLVVDRVAEQLVGNGYDFTANAPHLFALARRLWVTDAQAECSAVSGNTGADLENQLAALNDSSQAAMSSALLSILKGAGPRLKLAGKGAVMSVGGLREKW